ncbi:cell wall-active antibiotics response protein LiaF [Cytobacillus sp. IB215316]|uniref:cell wall-active antibiotics response protein LiaF n=1 Tax=Cytobacillus sp. IB215316 TaxID=3097354 RepID=UPI002A112578|nr:cell wall-active antibiotics response protein LiaF [Cytobacillus sp. IB215316]MDX8361938.1 cell wall-active antibiotics response protein LiaF [Cytobacillus sp. IB215316]
MKTLSQFIWGFLLVGIGIVLLLMNINVITLNVRDVFHFFYPFLFVIIGLKWVVEWVITKGRTGWFKGVFVIIFGSLLILDRFFIIEFGFWDVYKLWPLFFIFLGLEMFRNRKITVIKVEKSSERKDKALKKVSEFYDEDDDIPNDSKGVILKNFSIGTMKFDDENWAVKPINIKNMIGDYYFDFSRAYIPDKETEIVIQGLVGDIKMLIPEDIACKIDTTVNMGEVKVFELRKDGVHNTISFESDNYSNATRKLTIHLSLKAGSIRVDRV